MTARRRGARRYFFGGPFAVEEQLGLPTQGHGMVYSVCVTSGAPSAYLPPPR